MPTGDLVVFERVDGRFAWKLVAANGQVVATDGSQGYERETDALSMGIRVTHGDFMRDDLPQPDDPDVDAGD